MKPIDRDIIESFSKNFQAMKDKPVVIYGVGERTKLILENFPEFNFIGLMDKELTGSKYGLPILKKEDVIGEAYCIIIVCALHNLDIIYNRIKLWTTDNDIKVFHLNGELLEDRKKVIHGEIIRDIEVYKKSINDYDIISFDIFDTLVTRYVLYPEDIGDILAHKYFNSAFKENRKKAELMAMEKYGECYNLRNIYEELISFGNLAVSDVEEWVEMEVRTEMENVLPRDDVLELLNYAQDLNKKIILVSDMYLTKEQIIRILNKCGINEDIFDNIYISNEYSMSKSNGELWRYISEECYKEKKILHFGDNEISDINKAKEYGIEALPVYSGLKLALMLLDSRWLDYDYSFINRYIMGSFIARFLNSPFSICDQGTINIKSLREVGCNFFGPIVKCFMDKLYEQAKAKKQKIVFQARDCWILKELADKYYNKLDVPSVYLLTSRRQIAIASIKTEQDIDRVCDVFKNSCKYTFSEFCKVIFNIEIGQDKYSEILISEISEMELKEHLRMYYKERIIKEADWQRTCFEEYLSELNLRANETLAIVNFVGSGGTQFFFEQYGFKECSEYYYFALAPLRIELDLSKTIAIFGQSSNFTGMGNAIAERTMIGECVFTSPQSQFMGFNDNGEFDFSGDGVNSDYTDIKECHNGIYEYINTLYNIGIDYKDSSPELINIIYSYLFDRNIVFVSEEVKKAFALKDIVKFDETYNPWE